MHLLRYETPNMNDVINTYECPRNVVGDVRKVIKKWGYGKLRIPY